MFLKFITVGVKDSQLLSKLSSSNRGELIYKIEIAELECTSSLDLIYGSKTDLQSGSTG